MKQFVLLVALFFLCGPLPAFPNLNPHPDPDRPRVYTHNYHWQAQPELAEQLMRSSRLKQQPEVEKLIGCMTPWDYLVIPAAGSAENGLDLSCFNQLERNDIVVIAGSELNITVFPEPPPRKDRWVFTSGSAVEKRILSDKEPFEVRISGEIQDTRFSFYNCSSRELLAFPVQEKVTSLRLSFHPSDAVFDWRILEKFPNVTRLEISGADRFLHREEFKRNLRGLELHGCRNIDLPPLKLLLLELDCCEFRPGLLDGLDPADLQAVELNGLPLTDVAFLERFSSCGQLTISNCPGLKELTPLAGLKKLFRLRLQNNSIEDLSPLAGKEISDFVLSGSDPAIDRPLGEGFANREFRKCTITHPRKVELDGHRWQLEISGKRSGDTFLPENAVLIRDDYVPPSRFRLDPRSGQRDYPAPGLIKYIAIPPVEKPKSITIKGTQRFTDFMRIERNKVTLVCAEGEFQGTF